MIAALFVETDGHYFGLEGVDPWDAKRDARNYVGPWPVVAHPPCSRWCRLAGLVEKRWGYKRGADDGCFASALRSVSTFGGVLEHPAFSDAWPRFNLPDPPHVGWGKGFCGGWSCHVEQVRYGHAAKKATWLYAFGVVDLPSLRWGRTPDQQSSALVSWCGNHTKTRAEDPRPRLSKGAASRTPVEFRDILIGIARSAAMALLLASCTYPVTNVVNEITETDARAPIDAVTPTEDAQPSDLPDSSQIEDAGIVTPPKDASAPDTYVPPVDADTANSSFGRCQGTTDGSYFDIACGDNALSGKRLQWTIGGNVSMCTDKITQGSPCKLYATCYVITQGTNGQVQATGLCH